MPPEGGSSRRPGRRSCRIRKGRGMRSPNVHLREITDDNRDAVRALRVRRDQKQFVASVSHSLKEAAKKPEANPWYRAVYRGDEPVGFVMLSWKPPTGPYQRATLPLAPPRRQAAPGARGRPRGAHAGRHPGSRGRRHRAADQLRARRRRAVALLPEVRVRAHRGDRRRRDRSATRLPRSVSCFTEARTLLT